MMTVHFEVYSPAELKLNLAIEFICRIHCVEAGMVGLYKKNRVDVSKARYPLIYVHFCRQHIKLSNATKCSTGISKEF